MSRVAEGESVGSGAAPAGWGWLLPAVLVALAGIVAQIAYPPNDDAAWLMTVARRMTEGAALYSADLVEINPPLIIWMTWLTVGLADVVGVEAVTAWRLFVGAMVFLSLWLSARCLAASREPEDRHVHSVLLVAVAAVCACLPGYQSGQREHFIVLWFTPYLLATAAAVAGSPPPFVIRAGAGLGLGLALALKPHYALAVLLVEAGVVAHQRSLRGLVRPLLLVAAAVGAAYLAVVAVCCPGFYAFALPLALRYYHVYSTLEMQPVHLVYGVAMVAAVVLTSQPRVAALRCRLFALAGVGAYGAFVLQNRGWPYHFLPAKSFFLIAVSGAVAAWAGRRFASWPAPRGRVLLRGAALVLVLLSIGSIWQQAWAFQGTRQARVIRNVARYLNGVDFGDGERRFAALSLTLFPAFPVNEMLHARWCSRFSCLWILPGIVDAETRRNGTGEATGRAYLEGAVCNDFEKWRPTVVLVEESHQMSTLPQLLKSECFRTIWRDYELVGHVEYFDVYRRRPPPRAASARPAIEHLDPQGGERLIAAPETAGRLQSGAEHGALGSETRVAPVVEAIDVEQPDLAPEAGR